MTSGHNIVWSPENPRLGKSPRPPVAPDCSHDVFSLLQAGIDAAAATVEVQCSSCEELGEATVNVDWS